MHCLSVDHSATLQCRDSGYNTPREGDRRTYRDEGVVDILVVFACLEIGQRGAAFGRVRHHLQVSDDPSPQQASALAFSVLTAISVC